MATTNGPRRECSLADSTRTSHADESVQGQPTASQTQRPFVSLSLIFAGKTYPDGYCRCASHDFMELHKTCCVCHLLGGMEADHECSDFGVLGAIISNIKLL